MLELHQGSRKGQSGAVYYVSQWPFNGGKYRWPRGEECASGRDFIIVKTHFPMGVNVLGGIYEMEKWAIS